MHFIVLVQDKETCLRLFLLVLPSRMETVALVAQKRSMLVEHSHIEGRQGF